MTQRQADHGLAVCAAWRADLERLQRALAPLAQGRPGDNPNLVEPGHPVSWHDRHQGLQQELAHRAAIYPRELDRARLTAEDARHRVTCLQAMLAFYEDGLDWPEDPATRAALYAEITASQGPAPQQELKL